MAIVRSAGTEIIRSIHLETVSNASEEVILGVQHHIYTVLSIIAHAAHVNTAGNHIRCYLQVYDSLAGESAQAINIFQQNMNVNETFVWNDKFSFNGFEPVDFTAGMDSIAKQDAIADQGSAVAQKLFVIGAHASDIFDLTITFIDQNNS